MAFVIAQSSRFKTNKGCSIFCHLFQKTAATCLSRSGWYNERVYTIPLAEVRRVHGFSLPTPEQTMSKKRRDPFYVPASLEEHLAILTGQPLERHNPPTDPDAKTVSRTRLHSERPPARAIATTPPAEDAPAIDRASGGRFAKGNRGGPGNPFARQTAALRAALIQAVTEQDIKDIVTVLVRDAKRGQPAAIKLLFSYVIGKPAAAIDPDTLDMQEMDLLQHSAPPPPDTLETLRQQLPLSVLLEQLHNAQANNELQAKQTMHNEQTAQAAPSTPIANATAVAPPPRETTSSTEERAEPADPPAAPSTNDENGSRQMTDRDKRPALTDTDSGQPVGKRNKRPSVNGENGARDPATGEENFPPALSPAGGASGT